MHKEFEITMMGELAFLLRLQIEQENDDIFIIQAKYNKELIKKKFDLDSLHSSPTLMSTTTKLDKHEQG